VPAGAWRSRTTVRKRTQQAKSPGSFVFLAKNGSRVTILHLQGVLFFGNADAVRTEIDSLARSVDTIILDFRYVTDIDVSGAVALRQASARARGVGRKVLFSGLRDANVEQTIRTLAADDRIFTDLDAALERSEDEILRELQGEAGSELEVMLEESDFGRSMAPKDVAVLGRHMRRVSFPAGAPLCRSGDASDQLWVLTRGSVSAW
jgi:sulfate permease, SulP family